MDLIPLRIDKLVSTETGTGAFLMVMKEADKDNGRILPIVIGPYEAQAIIFGMEKNIEVPRPITHDLFFNVLRTLGYKLTKVVINKFSEGVFYARLILEKDGSIMEFDSRPSDAVALAVRFQAPVYTTEEVLKKTGVEPEKLDKMDKSEEDDLLFENLKNDQEDFDPPPFIRDIDKEIDKLISELEDVFGNQDNNTFKINLNDEDAKELAESFFRLMDKLLSQLPGGKKKNKMPDEEELTRMMNEAIANEDYERAAQLRDALKMLQKMKKSSGSGEKDKDDTGDTDHPDDE